MSDRRLTPATTRVAHVSLPEAEAMGRRRVAGEAARIVLPLADLLARPGGPRDRQVLFGEAVLILDRMGGHAFVRARKDGYCGWLGEAALGPDHAVTHWIAAPASHIYSAPDLKSPERLALPHGARLEVTGQSGRFCELAGGGFVPAQHVRAEGDWADDPVAVAESLIGAPYLWGGNSAAGIDCSGLVQAAILATGRDCPGDSDLQEAAFALRPEGDESLQRGDLLFWKGHVAMADGAGGIVHANAHRMAVTREDADAAIARIADQGGGKVTSVRRP